MSIHYLTNISDPILKTDKKYRKYIRSLLVSEIYASAFKRNGNKASDFDFLLSDNGNFTRLTKIAGKYELEAKEIDRVLDELQAKKKPLSKAIIDRRKKLNAEVIKVCLQEAKSDINKITANQLAINPTAIIGGEDTTIPVLQLTGAFDPRFKDNIPSLLPFQAKTLSLYAKQYRGEYGGGQALAAVKKYLVIHVVNYEGLLEAIKNANKIKFDGIALSLGAPLKSRRSVSEIKLGQQIFKFKRPLPESYLLTVALLVGLRNQVKKTVPIHILGLGTPILILLAGYIFKDFKLVTIDSTSTYTKDLEDDKIFGRAKMDLYKLVASCILKKQAYRGISPYFQVFGNKYKANWQPLMSRFKGVAGGAGLDDKERLEFIRLNLKNAPAILKANVPFFTPIKLADRAMVKELRMVRAFENYWANHSICVRLNDFNTKKQVKAHIADEIAQYKFYSEPIYYEAVEECRKIIEAA